MRHSLRTVLSLALAGIVMAAGFMSPASAHSVNVHKQPGDKVLHVVARQSGKWYRYGGAGPNTFDCAGLVQYVYSHALKKRVGRTSGQQLHSGRRISKKNIRKGDIMIFIRGGYAYHSAIYAGRGVMWEAARTGTRVGRHSIWSQSYVVVRPS